MVPVEMAASMLEEPSRGSNTATYLGLDLGWGNGCLVDWLIGPDTPTPPTGTRWVWQCHDKQRAYLGLKASSTKQDGVVCPSPHPLATTPAQITPSSRPRHRCMYKNRYDGYIHDMLTWS